MSSNLHKYKNTFLIIGIFFVLALIMLTAYSWYLLFEFSLNKQALQNSNKSFERAAAERQNDFPEMTELDDPQTAYSFEQKQANLDSINEVEGDDAEGNEETDNVSSGLESESEVEQSGQVVTGNNSQSESTVSTPVESSTSNSFEAESQLETEVYTEAENDDVPDETGYSESQKRSALNNLDTVSPEEETQTEEETKFEEESTSNDSSSSGTDEASSEISDEENDQLEAEASEYEVYDDDVPDDTPPPGFGQ